MLANGPLAPAVDARLRAAAALANTRLLSGHAAGQQASAALERARASADPEAIALALHASGEAAHNAARHHTALQNFRELRTLTGPLHLAEEITALQFLDRYDHAQTLLDTSVRRGCQAVPESFLVPLRTACEVGFLLRLVPGVPRFRS